MAAKTWDPKHDWRAGGGGNAWDGIAYDAKRNLVYFGTSNGAPWNSRHRSPSGGDNLFIASIVALHADSGEYAGTTRRPRATAGTTTRRRRS